MRSANTSEDKRSKIHHLVIYALYKGFFFGTCEKTHYQATSSSGIDTDVTVVLTVRQSNRLWRALCFCFCFVHIILSQDWTYIIHGQILFSSVTLIVLENNDQSSTRSCRWFDTTLIECSVVLLLLRIGQKRVTHHEASSTSPCTNQQLCYCSERDACIWSNWWLVYLLHRLYR